MLRLSRRSLSTLVVLEHKAGKLNASNLSALTAAAKIGGPVAALVAGGADAEAAAKAACALPGLSKVLFANHASLGHQMAETHASLLATMAKSGSFTHIVSSHTAYAKNVFPRAAAILDVSPIADVTEVQSDDTFKRPIYAGNAIALVKSSDKIKMITVRTTAFPPGESTGGSAALESVAHDSPAPTKWLSEQVAKSDRPELGAAKVVISGGRGLKSGENFELLYKLADKLGGAVGASRAAVDAGYVGNDLQIGQTGKIIAPQLYIAVGISGAIQVNHA